VHLSVRDDGDGFDPAARTAGFGLLGMRERAELLNGTLDIDSAPGNGTTVTAMLPAPLPVLEQASFASAAVGEATG
jgi:signal transduction histidine kinase